MSQEAKDFYIGAAVSVFLLIFFVFSIASVVWLNRYLQWDHAHELDELPAHNHALQEHQHSHSHVLKTNKEHTGD